MLNRSESLKLFTVILSVVMIVSLFASTAVFGAEAQLCGGNLSDYHRGVAAGYGLLSKISSVRCTELRRYSI